MTMKKTISVLLAFLMILSLTTFSAFAVDYPSDWAREEVNAAEAEGLITEAVKKDYHKNITREEFCELVVKLYEKITGEKAIAGVDVFVDTNNTEILKAYSLGIVNGISKDKFAPRNFITRQEICAMLVRCIDVAIDGADIHIFNTYDFVDKGKIANWAIDSVYYAYQHGIMKGVGNNSIAPLNNTTCEQAILLVYRIFTDRNVLGQKTDVAYETDISYIETDDTTDISYVNNIVLIFFKDTATKEDEDQVVAAINGNVVGRFDTINQIQVQVNKSSLKELIALCDKVESFDAVLSATYDVAVQIDTNAITAPNDKWDNDDWNENSPSGNNWWLEAIQAPSAWNYNKDLNNIKIGIVDNGFDTGHEDLKGKISFPNNIYAGGNNKEDHGTHVAGIIGASANNEKGITGIVWNSELICFDWEPSWVQEMLGGWNTSTFIAAGLIETVKSGAKVINFSLGTSGSLANHRSSYSNEQVNAFGNTASMYMAGLLHQGYDFVVVQSAGNGAADGIGVDAINNGWFSSITRNNCFSRLGNVDEVLSRIIIVGAAQQNNSSYIQAPFSNGGSQVDICAPGVNVYSTVTGGMFGRYAKMSGTSMAAPIVTGVAALVWVADPSLSGDKVKAIICDHSNSHVTVADNTASPNATGAFQMVNAKKCVEDALNIVLIPEIHYYEFFDSVVDTWEEAQAYCKSLGGHLAALTSQEENDYVYQQMVKAGYKSAYFGLTDADVEGTWTWITKEPTTYQNWHSGEPNAENQNEDYAMFYYKYSDGTWNDGDFGVRTANSGKVFICEWDTEAAYRSYLSNYDDIFNLLYGNYIGSYYAEQGETGSTLTVFKGSGKCKALFEFYNLPGRTNAENGSYYMDVSYNSSDKAYVFKATDWIEKPSTYHFVDLKGVLDIDNNEISGNSPTKFRLVKAYKLPEPDTKLSELVGTYIGSYFASQGETGLTLTVYHESNTYKAIFEFYNLPEETNARSGKYYMDVTYNPYTDTFGFIGTKWIDRPSTYSFLNLCGSLSNGTLNGTSPTVFSVERVD